MARSEDVVALLGGWLIWDWFFGDNEDGEQEGNDGDTRKVGSDPEGRPEGGNR